MQTTFQERYAKLNSKQREAVDSIEGPVMVIAGPGTGKTSILTLRIANILLRTDTPASGILAITYTDAGVKAMRMKLREVIGARADEVRIHTYHGFAAAIIHEFDEHFPQLSKAVQMTDIDAESIIRTILRDERFARLRPAGEPEFYVNKMARAISDSKREAWTPEMVREHAQGEIQRVKSDESSLSSRGATKGELKGEAIKRIEKCERTVLFAGVYEAYEAQKKKDKKMDFDDLIIELVSALRKDELLLRLIQEKFLYILVDEHQDTNDSQNLLVRLIADFFEEPNLFVVGDEKQAIYRFQGASVENFLRFQGIWKSMKVISLDTNYRSHQSILDASYSLIENNYAPHEHKGLRVRLSSGSGSKAQPIDVVEAGNMEAGERYLVEEVSKLVATKESVAIISRTNRDIERLIALLDASGIPAAAERGADIFSHPVGILFFDLVRFLADPSEIEALAKTLAGGLWKLTFADRTVLIRSVRAGNASDIERLLPALRGISREISRSGALDFIIHAAEASGFVDIALRNPLSVEVWRGIVALSSELSRRGSLEDPKALISELLAYQTSAEDKSVKVSVGSPEAKIRIMTAHGSKGLEFDHVFVPYAVEESWMPRARSSYFILPREREEGDDVRDARRLFYVALTRARKHVTVISAVLEGGKELVPLRFVSELDSAHVSKKSIPAYLGKQIEKRGANIDERRKSELVEYAKASLLERGLSVTALNHFSTCPSMFYYKSILRLPEPPSASAEKGNAMHEAIAEVWKLAPKGEKSITSALKAGIERYFERSLLPLFEKKSARAELVENAPFVAKALLGHFSQSGVAKAETWMETPFRGSYDGTPVDIRIHGKLDAVVVGDDKVSVYDYKTRGAMSPAAIKGETKDATGDYFRQLIYYKLLLESNPVYKGKVIEPSLVFVKPDDKGRCPTVTLPVAKADIERVRGEIQGLIQSVWSGKVVTDICDDEKCEWCRLKRETL